MPLAAPLPASRGETRTPHAVAAVGALGRHSPQQRPQPGPWRPRPRLPRERCGTAPAGSRSRQRGAPCTCAFSLRNDYSAGGRGSSRYAFHKRKTRARRPPCAQRRIRPAGHRVCSACCTCAQGARGSGGRARPAVHRIPGRRPAAHVPISRPYKVISPLQASLNIQ